MRSLKQITEELYPMACGQNYVPDDIAHEGVSMSISWRMANAIHFCLLGHCSHARCMMKTQTYPEAAKRCELWHELSTALIERLCKAKNPELFKDTPLDEYTVFTALRDSAPLRETKKKG